MIPLLQDCLLGLWVVISILAPGAATYRYFRRTSGLPLLAYGAGVGVIIHGLFGLAIAVTWRARPILLIVLLLLILVSLGYLWKQGILRDLRTELPRRAKLFLGCWLMFIVICIGIVQLPIRWPRELPDGRYVFKEHTLNVRIQVMTSLPADNFTPYVVAQYLLRGIPFRSERPLLPATEVSSRTILMSLVCVPLLATTDPAPKYRTPLSRFDYVGTSVPNTLQLYSDASFRHFLVCGIVLNSLLLLGLGCLFAKFDLLPIAAALYATNPYFIQQTVFTWPKAFAAFFVVLIWDSIARRDNAKLTGLWAGLAYHAHPYGLVFAIGAAVYYIYQYFRNRFPLKSAIQLAGTFGLLALPWLIWTDGILRIPSNLLRDNLFTLAQTADTSISFLDFCWIRLVNIFDLLMPTFFSVYPFQLSAVLDRVMNCLPGAVGIILIGPAIRELFRLRDRALWCVVAVLPGLLLIGAFSYRAIACALGYQAMIGALIVLGLQGLHETLRRWLFWSFTTFQLLLNVVIVFANGYLAGVQLP